MDFLYAMRSIVALIVVIWLANSILKYLEQYSNRSTKSIQIIERISVSKTSSLAIVKIVEDYYLMSFSEGASETLKQFSAEEAEEIEAKLVVQKSSDSLATIMNVDAKAFSKTKLTELKNKYDQFFVQK